MKHVTTAPAAEYWAYLDFVLRTAGAGMFVGIVLFLVIAATS